MMIKVSNWKNYKTKVSTKNPEGNLIPVSLDNNNGISLDLTIKGIDVRNGGSALYKIKSKYILKPGTCVVLETAEHITTGKKVFGFICSRAKLSASGLIVSNLKVDPNYSDSLYITAFNASSNPITLTKGDAFCALVFTSNEEECNVKVRRPDSLGIQNNFWNDAKKALPYILTYIGSVATAILAIYTLLNKN